MHFSKQAKLAIVGYTILILSVFLPNNRIATESELFDPTINNHKNYHFYSRVFYCLAMVLPMLISVYTINCMTMGSIQGGKNICSALSWVNSLSVFVWAILVALLSFSAYKTVTPTSTVPTITMHPDDVINIQQGPPAVSTDPVTTVPKVGTNVVGKHKEESELLRM